ncbi:MULTISPECIES: hypothetical protein [Clostridia]|uniref:hypothetical protein n=1 Tax=Clostridia TaxID=186801 RepID=UPI0013143718|nr:MULTISPECIES: hypothetical protein [Clostridia]
MRFCEFEKCGSTDCKRHMSNAPEDGLFETSFYRRYKGRGCKFFVDDNRTENGSKSQ